MAAYGVITFCCSYYFDAHFFYSYKLFWVGIDYNDKITSDYNQMTVCYKRSVQVLHTCDMISL